MRDNLKSIYAGLVIGLGGYVFLSVEDKVLGSFLFSIGLVAVLIFGLNLYTGKACNIDYLKKPLKLIKIWILNYVGVAIIVGGAICNDNLVNKSGEIAIAKLSKPLYIVFIDAVVCGICIAIAVKGYAKSRNFLVVVLGVMVFILAGAEHVIADMFYLGLSGMDFRKFVFILVVTLGNTVGGILSSCIDRDTE